jgi:hypothetical protein
VTCGNGVNLFFSAYDWNSPRTLEKFASHCCSRTSSFAKEACRQARRDFASRRIRNCRRAYAFLFVRSPRKRVACHRGSSRRLLARDPLLPFGCRSCSSRCCSTAPARSAPSGRVTRRRPERRHEGVQPFEASLRRLGDACVVAQLRGTSRPPASGARRGGAGPRWADGPRPPPPACAEVRPLAVETRRTDIDLPQVRRRQGASAVSVSFSDAAQSSISSGGWGGSAESGTHGVRSASAMMAPCIASVRTTSAPRIARSARRRPRAGRDR